MATQIVMDQSGDRRHSFDQADTVSLAKAEHRFRMLTNKGYTATTRATSGELKLVRSFDPTASETLFYPRLVGG